MLINTRKYLTYSCLKFISHICNNVFPILSRYDKIKNFIIALKYIPTIDSMNNIIDMLEGPNTVTVNKQIQQIDTLHTDDLWFGNLINVQLSNMLM